MRSFVERASFTLALALRRAMPQRARTLRETAGDDAAELFKEIVETVRAVQDFHRQFLIMHSLWEELSREIDLDPERLARIEAETARVSALLGEVFARDDEPEPEPGAADPARRFPGLEARHAGFLAELAERDAIHADAFAALARRHALLPAGAMEAINDWAFDRIGESVLNDGDPIEIACHLLRPREGWPQQSRRAQ